MLQVISTLYEKASKSTVQKFYSHCRLIFTTEFCNAWYPFHYDCNILQAEPSFRIHRKTIHVKFSISV